MADSYKEFNGAFVAMGIVIVYLLYADYLGETNGFPVFAKQMKAKPGKADELARWLANLKVRADSNEEPRTLVYEVTRLGDTFALWEKYGSLLLTFSCTSANMC